MVFHLLDVYDKTGRWAGLPGSSKRARQLQWGFYAVGNVDDVVIDIFLMNMGWAPKNEGYLERNMTFFKDRVIPTVERGLGDKLYLDGDELTAADFFVGYTLGLAHRIGLLDHSEKLKAYAERIVSRAAYKEATTSPNA
jgi:glutathione S-transferase